MHLFFKLLLLLLLLLLLFWLCDVWLKLKEAYGVLEKWFYIYWMNLKFLAIVRSYF